MMLDVDDTTRKLETERSDCHDAPLEIGDMQRLIVFGFGERKWTQYVLLRIRYEQRSIAKAWLREQLPPLVPASSEDARHGVFGAARAVTVGEAGVRLSLAFTYLGLEALGLDRKTLATFVTAFRQGMTAPHRARALGDVGKNASEKWDWGQWRKGDRESQQVHLLCAAYARTKEELDAWAGRPEAAWHQWRARGFDVVDIVDAKLEKREPFGFRDGISQPHIKGSGRAIEKVPERDQIEAGEFVFGYRNAFGQVSESPYVDRIHDPEDILPSTVDANFHDLGRNGTFLVVRELEQHVEEFEKLSLRDRTCAVGRWKDGTPLVLRPLPIDRDAVVDSRPAGSPVSQNDFTYFPEDAAGLRCPLGAHVRRSNPRDALANPALQTSAADAIRLANMHRILRRSRVYSRGNRKGLFFQCINTNLERQFEFVQQTWINNLKFGGPYEEDDPLTGGRADAELTVAAAPERRRLTNLASYVTVRGGAYFFLPGLRALRYLSSINDPPR